MTTWQGEAFNPGSRQLLSQIGLCPELSVYFGGAEFALTYKDLPWRQKHEDENERDIIVWPWRLENQDHRCEPKEVGRIAYQCQNCQGLARMARLVGTKHAVWNECHCCQMFTLCDRCRRGVHPADLTRYESFCIDCWHAFCNKCSYCDIKETIGKETMQNCSKGNDCKSPAEIGRICKPCILGRLIGDAMRNSPTPGEPPIIIQINTSICGCCNKVDCFGYKKNIHGEIAYVVENTPPVDETPRKVQQTSRRNTSRKHPIHVPTGHIQSINGTGRNLLASHEPTTRPHMPDNCQGQGRQRTRQPRRHQRHQN